MQKIFKILIPLVFINACTQHQAQKIYNLNSPIVVEANGYIVPKDSMAAPKVIPVDESKLIKIPAGKPNVILINPNVHVAGEPKSVLAGTPRICTPGQDTFLLPKTVPEIDKPIIAGIPQVVIVKDASLKDPGTQNFSSFGKPHGLKDNMVQYILQDNFGNLWFATWGGGVSKYDGKYFTTFTEKEGLLSNWVLSILQDKTGNFWFGTGSGVSKYDGKYFTSFNKENGFCNNYVWSILQDKNGNIWFATWGRGVFEYNGKSFTNFTVKEGLINNIVNSIIQDRSGNLWFGTNGGISKYDGTSFSNFTEKEGLSKNLVCSIFQDTSESIWIGTDGGGISKYDGKSFTYLTEKEGLCNNVVNSIFLDKSGNLWFGTSGGVSKYDGKYFTDFTEKEGLCNNLIHSILQDKSGDLWFGTELGVTKYDAKPVTNFAKKEGLSSAYIWSIFQDKIGNIWFGTLDGVGKYDGKSITYFSKKEGLCDGVQPISQDKTGNLWFGTGKGVTKYDGESFTNFTVKEGFSNNGVNSILQDKSGNLWFGTNGGVSKYDGKSFTNYTEKEGLCSCGFLSIIQDKSGNLWFGSGGDGVFEYNGQSFTHFTEKEGLCNNAIWSITQDKSGNLWFATMDGVSKYDGKSFTNFNEKQGLSSNIVYSVLQDRNGILWFGTAEGLNKLTPENLAWLEGTYNKSKYSSEGKENIGIMAYTLDNSLLGICCNPGGLFADNAGTVWIGFEDRLTAYRPEGEEPDTIPPNIQVTGIELFNEKIPWVNLENKKDSNLVLGNGVSISKFKFNGVSKWYGLPENLSLVYDNNYLTFSFIGITRNLSKNAKYRYKLEGIDKYWSAITSHTEASYANLPHGRYTFKVKAMNIEGYWSDEYKYSFIIRPPWWETLLFRIILMVLIVFALVFYAKWRERKLRRDNRLLEETVKVRTEEVVSQKKHIEYVHEQISLSINYAKRIQMAILPESSLLNQNISEHFVLLRPKENVSGDFYWWTVIENNLVITVADCTGHGVPGAFMSMLGISFLQEIVINEYMTDPAIILKQLRKEIIHALKQTGSYGEPKDGMDIALLTINTETFRMQYAGAINPLYIISSLNNELIEIKPDKMTVAISDSMENFTNHELKLKKGDLIYLLTDGFQDQFGGPNGKKFMRGQLKNLLVTNSRKSMAEQNQILETTLTNWIGDREQTDDITVVGLRI